MKILTVASECAPVAKVGGLADVAGSLPKALKSLGVDISVVLPFYQAINIEKKRLHLIEKKVPVLFNEKKVNFELWKTFLPHSKVPLLLVKNDDFFSGKGVYVESDASSGGSEKEAERFLFLSAASIEIAKLLKADFLHCHDWHTGITPFLINKKKLDLKTLLTIHNLGYQGIYPAPIVNRILDTNFRSREVNCLKLGILNTDFINTVSPSYAEEILTPKYGLKLYKYLRKRKKSLTGILNGLDEDQFDPQHDSFLKKNYSWKSLEKKQSDKAYLQKKCFKKVSLETPILAIVSRLAEQKGIDLIQKIFKKLMKRNLQFVLLGVGDPFYEKFFRKASQKYPKKCYSKIEFNEKLAHQIYGGADMFLMPSRFEPCGLGQQIAMKYGTIPVARKTGGIKDTVSPVKIDGGKVKGTGFLFKRSRSSELFRAIKEALKMYENKKLWQQIQRNGMKKNFSWKKSAQKYKALYRKIIKQ